jgi:hypothetical protein
MKRTRPSVIGIFLFSLAAGTFCGFPTIERVDALLFVSLPSSFQPQRRFAAVVPSKTPPTKSHRRSSFLNQLKSQNAPHWMPPPSESQEEGSATTNGNCVDLTTTTATPDPSMIERPGKATTTTAKMPLDLSTTRQLLSHFETLDRSTTILEDAVLLSSPSPTTTDDSRSPYFWMFFFQTAGIILAGTYAMSCVLTDLLSHLEWVRAWRYTWPFGIGALYMALNSTTTFWWDEKDVNNSSKTGMITTPLLSTALSSSIAECMTGESLGTRVLLAVLGLGVVIGGAYDIWMPVYMTGPNVVTAAGIGQDAAVGLFGWTLWRVVVLSSSWRSSHLLEGGSTTAWPITQRFLLQALLLAELYKLGEGAFDELFFSKLIS